VLIDGRFPHVLAIRDLASGYQLLWEPVLRQTAQPVFDALVRLFTIHGAPLVLKSDNGSAFLDAEVRALLGQWQVFPLYSPPRTPQYNGACEASIGSLKRRTQRQVQVRTAANAEPEPDPTWTSADLDAAQEQANAEPNSRRPGPSRAQVWEARTLATAEERTSFGEAYRREEELARREKRHPDGPLTRPQQAAVDRIALRRAMLARDYLEFRRRRISPPIPRKKCDTTG
jgi:transposase InsO family protein